MIFTPIHIGQMLNYILETTIILYTLKNLLHFPLTSSKVKRYLGIALLAAWLLYTLISDSPLPETFIILPVSLLIFCEHPTLISFTVISETLAIIIINTICFYLYYMATYDAYNSLLHTYVDLISLIGILAIIIKFRTKMTINICFLNKMHTKHFILIFCVILVDFFLSIASGLLFLQNINQSGRRILVLAIYTMVILSIVTLILYFRIVHIHSELEQISNMKSKMLSLEEQHYKDMLKKNKDLRSFRHDYNYHITAMQALAQNNDFNALKDYVNHLTKEKAKMYFISTNNTIADAIINYFYENLPEDTKFKIDGKFSDDTFISNDDLCIILSNLLKNAYEAVCNISMNNRITYDNADFEIDKHIYISIYNNNDNVNIYIENSYVPSQNNNNNNFATSKSDTINHGFGLKNVKSAVEKYDGKLELKTDKNIFSAYVFLHNNL